MKYKIEHELLTGEDVQVEIEGLLDSPALIHNGLPILKKSSHTNTYDVKKSDGSNVIVALEQNTLDPFPTVKIEGKKIAVDRMLNFLDYILIVAPMLLVILVGVLGLVLGLFSARIVARLLLINNKPVARYGFSLLVIGISYSVAYAYFVSFVPTT
ncbi:MAG: hypothetical protein OEY96_13145 [Gammaproteobacteria bacterium]|nr:hypothetical protein [Gammaproteobacteria bacterium]